MALCSIARIVISAAGRDEEMQHIVCWKSECRATRCIYSVPILHRQWLAQLLHTSYSKCVSANQVELIKGLPSIRMTHIYTPDLQECDNQLALQLPEHNPMTLYPHPKQHCEDRSPVYT